MLLNSLDFFDGDYDLSTDQVNFNLESLDLYNNKLEELPESIGKLSTLKELDLYRNKLKNLPKSFGKLENLKRLTILENDITELPESIKKLKKLISLDFYQTQKI